MQRNAVLAGAAGALGGFVGSWMMVRFNHLLGGEGGGAPLPQYRDEAAPNEWDGTISDEPASIKSASRLGVALLGRSLSQREAQLAAPLFHYGFGTVVGAFYGVSAERTPEVTAGFGLPFGATVWLGAAEAGLPLAGLAAPPTHYSSARHLASLASHLVYGLTLEAVRRTLRGRTR